MMKFFNKTMTTTALVTIIIAATPKVYAMDLPQDLVKAIIAAAPKVSAMNSQEDPSSFPAKVQFLSAPHEPVKFELISTNLAQQIEKNPNGKTIKVITGNNADADYQLVSNRFPVKEGDIINILYKINVAAGGIMSLGLLNTHRNGWYGEELVLGEGTYEGIFTRKVPALEAETSLVFRNYHLVSNGGPGQSTFTIEECDIQKAVDFHSSNKMEPKDDDQEEDKLISRGWICDNLLILSASECERNNCPLSSCQKEELGKAWDYSIYTVHQNSSTSIYDEFFKLLLQKGFQNQQISFIESAYKHMTALRGQLIVKSPIAKQFNAEAQLAAARTELEKVQLDWDNARIMTTKLTRAGKEARDKSETARVEAEKSFTHAQTTQNANDWVAVERAQNAWLEAEKSLEEASRTIEESTAWVNMLGAKLEQLKQVFATKQSVARAAQVEAKQAIAAARVEAEKTIAEAARVESERAAKIEAERARVAQAHAEHTARIKAEEAARAAARAEAKRAKIEKITAPALQPDALVNFLDKNIEFKTIEVPQITVQKLNGGLIGDFLFDEGFAEIDGVEWQCANANSLGGELHGYKVDAIIDKNQDNNLFAFSMEDNENIYSILTYQLTVTKNEMNQPFTKNISLVLRRVVKK